MEVIIENDEYFKLNQDQEKLIKYIYFKAYHNLRHPTWRQEYLFSKTKFHSIFFNSETFMNPEKKSYNFGKKEIMEIIELMTNKGLSGWKQGKATFINKIETWNEKDFEVLNQSLFKLYRIRASHFEFLEELIYLKNKIDGFGHHIVTEIACYMDDAKYPLITEIQWKILWDLLGFQKSVLKGFNIPEMEYDFVKKNRSFLYQIYIFTHLQNFIDNLNPSKKFTFFSLNKLLFNIHKLGIPNNRSHKELVEKLLSQWKIVINKFNTIKDLPSDIFHFNFKKHSEMSRETRKIVIDEFLKYDFEEENDEFAKEKFTEFWNRLYSARVLRGQANYKIRLNKTDDGKFDIIKVKNTIKEMYESNIYLEEWENQIRGARTTLWELFGVLNPKKNPIINNCTINALKLLFKNEIDPKLKTYNDYKKEVDKFLDDYNSKVGHLTSAPDFPKEFFVPIYQEIDQFFNVVDKVNTVRDLNSIKNKEVKTLFQLILEIKGKYPSDISEILLKNKGPQKMKFKKEGILNEIFENIKS